MTGSCCAAKATSRGFISREIVPMSPGDGNGGAPTLSKAERAVEAINGWDSKVRLMLEIAHLEAKPAYTTTEAAVILAVSPTTIRTMCEQWEPAHCKRDALECYRIGKGDRRIPFHALAEYLAANNEYDRI